MCVRRLGVPQVVPGRARGDTHLVYPVRLRDGGLLLAAPPSEALLAALVPDPIVDGESAWG